MYALILSKLENARFAGMREAKNQYIEQAKAELNRVASVTHKDTIIIVTEGGSVTGVWSDGFKLPRVVIHDLDDVEDAETQAAFEEHLEGFEAVPKFAAFKKPSKAEAKAKAKAV